MKVLRVLLVAASAWIWLMIAGPALAEDTVHFGNSLAAPGNPGPGATQSTLVNPNTEIIEAEGVGLTEDDARTAAIHAAIEQAVGVYIDTRRRTEMQITDDKVHEIVEEKIQSFSSGFVEKVHIVSASQDSAFGYRVKIRTSIHVPQLLYRMREANLPVVAVDAVSIRSKFATQLEMRDNATNPTYS